MKNFLQVNRALRAKKNFYFNFKSLLVLMIVLITASLQAWGTEITWTPNSSDISTLTDKTVANISVGSSSNTFKVYATRGGNPASFSYDDTEKGLKFGDNSFFKSGVAVYIPSTSNNVSSIKFYLKTSNASRGPKYGVLDAVGLTSEPGSGLTKQTLTTSYASYNPFDAGGITKEKYYAFGGQFDGSGSVFIQKIVVTFEASCTPPNHVDVAATSESGNYGWRYTTGETIKLTAKAYSTAGTSSEITSGLTYQWKKKTGESTWKNLTDGEDATDGGTFSGTTSANLQISGCTSGNAGTYKCEVSTGEGCTTTSNEYWVRVFTLDGNYSGEDWEKYPIVWTDEYNGTVTLNNINANTTFYFKVTDNDSHWYGKNTAINKDEDNFWVYRNDASNVAMNTGKVSGTYTIVVNIYHANDDNNPYCTLMSVRYPKMRIYMSGGSTTWCDANPVFFAHTYGQAPNDVMMSAHACETGLFYADVPSYNTKVTFTRQKPGSESIAWKGDNFWNKSKDEIVIGSNNKFTCTGWDNNEGVFSGSTYSPSTYTITFASNGSDGGSTMSNVTAIPCDENRTLAANTWTKTGHTFAGWVADVDVKVGGSTKTAGTVIDDEETIQNIRSNITLTAQWSVRSYDLTWNLGGGTTTSAGTGIASGVSANTTSSVTFGASLTAPTVTKTGYDFTAWDPSVESTMPAEAATYTATWTAKQYDISYKDQGGTALSGFKMPGYPSKHTYGTATTLKKASKDGYMFDGWYTNSTCTGDPVTSLGATDYTAKVYLYAKWTEANLTALANNTLYKAEDMVPDGIEFDATRYYPGVSANNIFNIRGSSKDSDNAKSGMASKDDTDQTIEGESFPYELSFRKPASGTKGTDLGEDLPDNHAIQFKISRAGKLDIYCYCPDSIYIVKSGSSAEVVKATSAGKREMVTINVTEGTYYLYGTCVTSKTRLYGLRFRQNYTITYNTDGASEDQIANGTKTHGDNFTLSSTRYTKDGYWQTGWATSQGGSQVYAFGATYTDNANLTLYPAWTPKAEYEPDLTTSANLSVVKSDSRWTLTTGANVVSDPSTVGGDAATNLTGDKYGLAFAPGNGSKATFDLGASTTIYKLTVQMVSGCKEAWPTIQFENEDYDDNLDEDPEWDEESAWTLKTFTYTYNEGESGWRYLNFYGYDGCYLGLHSIKIEYAPTKTYIQLDNQSATSAGTTGVIASWHATTNLTSSITTPTKTGYTFGGYYTEEDGAGTQLIDENGAWKASKSGYTDGSKNWQYPDADLTLYAKWTEDVTTYRVIYTGTTPTTGSLPVDDTEYSGDGSETVTVEGDNSMTLTGYDFRGWHDGTTFFLEGQEFTMPASDVTLTAVWDPGDPAPTALVSIDFTDETASTSYTAGSTYTIDGTSVYFKSAMSIYKDGGYLNLPGNASTSQNYIAVPLANINGEITITVTHNSTRPQWKHYFAGLNSAATSSNLSAAPSSMTDCERPGSNTTTTSWTISTNKSYGVFYVGRGSNGTNQFEKLTITTPGTDTHFSVEFKDGETAPASHTTWPSDIAGVENGLKILAPADPTAANYTFDDWYTTANCTTKVNYSTLTITADTKIYAKWYAHTRITTQPETSVTASKDVEFTLGTGMVAVGESLTYQWYSCDENGENLVELDGEDKATMTDTKTANGTYYYKVLVSGTYGDPTYVYSNKITVTVKIAISPSLSYDNTTLYANGGTPRQAHPTLTGNTGSGTVTYSSSKTEVVTVDSETGVVTAVGTGTARVTASIAATSDYNSGSAYVDFTVPALVNQSIRVGKSTSWNGDGSAAPDMTFNDPTSSTSQVAVIANNSYTFDATATSDKDNMTAKFTSTETSKNSSKYLTLKFKNATHAIRLGEVVVPIQPVKSNGKAQVEIYEGATLRLTSSEVTDITQGKLNDVHFTFASPYVFAANTNIEVRLYFYGQTDGFRLGTPFYVNGGVLVDQRFTDANSTGIWSDPANWDGGSLPEIYHDVVIEKPVAVDIAHATAKSIVIYNNGSDKTGKLTIQPNKGLEVAGTIKKTTDGSTKTATGEADLVLESSSAGNASLIFNNSNSCAATVQMYSKAGIDGSTWNWQYVGTPFTGSIPLYNYYGSWMYKWDNGGWAVVKGGDELDPFAGYCLTQSEATTHVMGGTLVPTTSKSVTMAASTDMVLANSWTAPISIASFDIEGGDATFTSTPATIYLFNTGSAKDGSSEGTEAGTYIAVPINSAPYTGNGLIAPMQGFFVTTNGGAAGTITMNYNDLVRPSGEHTDIVAGSMKAPKRIEERPEVMKIRAEGSVYNDRVVILSREDFSQGFDNGWDGKKMSFGNASPSVYVINEEGGYDAVSAIPEYEGTVVGFRAGTDSEYTIRFEYDGEEMLYLNDLQGQEATPIDSMRTYTFTAEAGDNEARFIISTTPIQKVITDIDPASGEQSAKVRKVIINDHIYIIRGGRMYSAEGALVK